MIRIRTNHRSFWAILLFFAGLSDVAVGSGGGSGMRGGTGVLCAGWKSPVVLEDFVANGHKIPAHSPRIEELLGKIPNSFLRKEIRQILASNGDLKNWADTDTVRERKSEYTRLNLDAHTYEYMERFLFAEEVATTSQENKYRVFDEDTELELGQTCKIVQLAVTVFGENCNHFGPILLQHGRRLSTQRQRMILTLHEALYIYGARLDHWSPIPTRNLLVALLQYRKGDGRILRATEEYLRFAHDREMAIRSDERLSPLREGRMVLQRHSGSDDRCAKVRLVAFSGHGTFVVRDIFDENSQVVRIFDVIPQYNAATLFRSGDCEFRSEPVRP